MRPNRLHDILKIPIIVLVWLKMNIKVNLTRVSSVYKHIKKAEYKIRPALTFLFSNPLFAAKNKTFFLTPIYWSKYCFVEL